MLLKLKMALYLQLPHLALSAIWNVAGVMLIAQGLTAPGPTASLLTASLLILFAALMLLGAVRYWPLYLLVTLLVLIAASMAIFSAFYKPASLWPSDFWRYTGVLLNLTGVIGAIWGIKIAYYERIKTC